MKRTFVALATMSLCFLGQQSWAAQQGTQLSTKQDKISYSIGVDVGKSIQKQQISVNPQAFMTGFKEGMTGKTTLMSENDIRDTLVALQTEMLEKQKVQMEQVATKNKQEGEKFLAKNKATKGIKTLPSGLQYRIIKEGSGTSPNETDVVMTHYRGKLINGTEFDSSYNRGEPVTFPVNGVIPGWTEALQLMKPGAKWELFVPSDLAYGENGVGQIIGPNSTLIFEVELLKVEKPETDNQSKTSQSQKAAAKKKG